MLLSSYSAYNYCYYTLNIFTNEHNERANRHEMKSATGMNGLYVNT